jgi:hypothetical protein
MQKENTPVNPQHYTRYEIQPIEICEILPYNLGCVVKYVLRYDAKNGLEDLEKANWYLERQISQQSSGKLRFFGFGDLHEQQVDDFISKNNMSEYVQRIIISIFTNKLQFANEVLQKLIDIVASNNITN